MASMSLGKLKNLLPFNNSNNSPDGRSKAKGFLGSLDPEVGFQMTLVPNQTRSSNGDKASAGGPSVPELHVKILGARHLPSIFGLKTVQGYVVKIKLFPGSLRFDSSIQTASWPTFNETFKFPMESTTKSSFKSKAKPTGNDPEQASAGASKVVTLPERLFKGHFLVLTVFALLELPAGSGTSIKHKLQQIRRKSSLMMTTPEKGDNRRNSSNTSASSAIGADEPTTPTKDIMQLTCSEQRRNIGSVTCFLDPRMFEENQRTGLFGADEMWLTLKDITVTSPSRSSNTPIASYPKGQVEMILQICDLDAPDSGSNVGVASSSASASADQPKSSASPAQSPQKRPSQPAESTSRLSHQNQRWTLGDMRRKLSISGSGKPAKHGLCLRITTSKMRCSIKVKEQFENMDNGSAMYIKTSVFEHDILASSWKSDQFAPSLSVRWSPENAELRIPLNGLADLQHIVVRTTIATKTKMGKKIVLGTLMLGGRTASGSATAAATEHWAQVAESAGQAGCGAGGAPIAVWHAFE